MQADNLTLTFVRGLLRPVLTGLAVCVLVVSGLTGIGRDASGQIFPDFGPASIESLGEMKFFRTYKSAQHLAGWCGMYSYNAAWYVVHKDILPSCMIYIENGNEFWLMQGDRLLPFSVSIDLLVLGVGESTLIYFDCGEKELKCTGPAIIPPTSSLSIGHRDRFEIIAVASSGRGVRSEGIEVLKSRVASLPNFPWRAKLCHVTDTRRYSDNCEDENAEANNFEIRISELVESKSFDLTWYGDDETNVRSFPQIVYVRYFGTVEPEPFYCWPKENDSGQADQKYTCRGEHALELEGNAIILGSNREAALDDATDNSDDIDRIPELEVKVVAMEITQGVQNWKNKLTLVKDRPTAVRVFVETAEKTELTREITAKLKLAILGGQRNIPSDTIDPIFPNKLVKVMSDAASRRGDFNSSINFKLEKPWIELEKDEQLVIEVVFDDKTICGENSEATACEKTVSFTEVFAPEIYMVPIPDNINDEDSIPSDEELREHFDRIMSVMPLANIEYQQLDVENALYRVIINGIRTRVNANNQQEESEENVGQEEPEKEHENKYGYIGFVRESMLNAIIENNKVADENKFYLGIISGDNHRTNEKGEVTKNEVSGLGGSKYAYPAVWYANEENVSNIKLKDRLGGFRNNGSHEFAHSLGQRHAVDSDGRVICNYADSEADENGWEYEFIYSLPSNNVLRSVEVATLGPLVDAERTGRSNHGITDFDEVWGLDQRFIEESNPINQLVVLNPREVFALMSYCIRRDNRNSQGYWMDSVYHQKIIDILSSKLNASNNIGYAESEIFSRVPSLLFFGIVKFSEDGEATGVDLLPLSTRNRPPEMSNYEGNYALEFRDDADRTVRSVSFQTFMPREGIAFSNGDLQSGREAYFAFQVENPPEYDELVFLLKGEEVASFMASLNSPSVSILSGPNSGQNISSDSFLNLSWASDDADDDDLVHNVYYSVDGGLNYELLRLRTEETSLSIDAGNLKGSDHARIGISVSDGIRSSFVETPIFSVEKHRPEVYIGTSSSDHEFTMPETVLLQAWGSDKDDNGPLSYSWQSNIDGDLGNGDTLSLPSGNFASGSHTITVTVTDSDGMSATTSVDIQINQEPVFPEIVDDTAFTQVDRLTAIDILANDIDLANTLDLSTLTIDDSPVHGYAKVSTLLTEHIFIEYISSVRGSDDFSYSICDTAGQCYTGEVTVFVALPDCTIMGTDEDDVLTGTSGDDVICGLGGNDTIDARGGNDIIHGGQGNDTIYARVGDDLIYGGDGDDFILAHRGDDIIRGGKGNDVIYAGGGSDGASGGDGADELYGEADNDNLFGDNGPDIIHGGRGDDVIYGGDGDDTIRGNAGADKIYPGAGTNTVLGITPLDTVLEWEGS